MLGEHLLDVRRHRNKRPATAQPFLKQNLRQCHRRHRRGVERDGAHLVDRHFADQQNRTHGSPRGDRDFRQNQQSRNLRIGSRRDDPDIGRSLCECVRASGRQRVGDVESVADLSVLKIPHQRGGIQVGNGGNT